MFKFLGKGTYFGQRFLHRRILPKRCISDEVRSKLLLSINQRKDPSEIVGIMKEASTLVENSTKLTHGICSFISYYQALFECETSREAMEVGKLTLSYMDESIPFTSYRTVVHMIQHYCTIGNIEMAWRYYKEFGYAQFILDSITFETFGTYLCDCAMIDEMEELLKVQKPTLSLLEKMIEPYIVSGRMYELSVHFVFVLQSNQVFSHLHGVSYAVELLMKARLRRAISGSPKTLSEEIGIQMIHKELNNFQEMLEEVDNAEKKPSGLGRCVATIFHYLAYCDESWDGESVPAPLHLSPEDRAMLDSTLAVEPSSSFQYMIEHRNFYDNDGFLDKSPFEVGDITSELAADKLTPPLLYRADLFYKAMEDERRFVTMICNDALDLQTITMFDQTLQQLEELDDEEDDDYDDEDDDHDEDFDDDEDFEESIDLIDDESVLDDFLQRSKSIHGHEISTTDAILAFEAEGEDLDENAEKVAFSKPRQRIHDLSRSLYNSFGRYKPTFDDEFFDEMEIMSYEDPRSTKVHVDHPFGDGPDSFPDDNGGTFSHQPSKPQDVSTADTERV